VRVVLDTNVFVSALLVPNGPPARLLEGFRDDAWELLISGIILQEYAEVLLRPEFTLPPSLVSDLLDEIRRKAIDVVPSKRYRAVEQDPDDNEFIDVAVEGRADFLVSGDQDLLTMKRFRDIRIVPPVEFLRITA
jgi:uncharacterized protein